MRFVSQMPGHAWWRICEGLIHEMVGVGLGTGRLRDEAYGVFRGTRFSVITPEGALGSLSNPYDVAEDRADIGITTPSVAGAMARAGREPYLRACPGLRAIAAYPHDDYLIFQAVTRPTINLLSEYLHSDDPVRIVTGRKSSDGLEDVLTYCVHEVLRRHGASFEDIAARPGSEVIFGGPTRVGGKLVVNGEADALFHEAQGQQIWADINSARGATVLKLDPQILEGLSADLGLAIRQIPSGHRAGTSETIPTLDFSGWLVFVDERMTDDEAYALAMACDRTSADVEGLASEQALVKPISKVYMFNDTGIPLHPGSLRYATEKGYVA